MKPRPARHPAAPTSQRNSAPVGRTVEAPAELVDVDGRRLRFAVRLYDGETLAAEGVVERVIVDRARFLIAAGAADASAS
jgi:fluoroacetyl-CoA thioesterase